MFMLNAAFSVKFLYSNPTLFWPSLFNRFNADGSSFTGPWGRPQNDGPGKNIEIIFILRDYVIMYCAHLANII